MNKRLELHDILCEIVNITEPDGDSHVYFQPPASVKMKYPAIVYSRDDIEIKHADDSVYALKTRYEVTVITDDPDSELIYKMSKLPLCRFNRHYTSDNLNHDTFTLYY